MAARRKCLGPDSNRHGVAPKGFSYHYSFHCCMPRHAFVVWTLPLPSRTPRARIRQEPSSLYTFLGSSQRSITETETPLATDLRSTKA
jgi:hypothetical protein